MGGVVLLVDRDARAWDGVYSRRVLAWRGSSGFNPRLAGGGRFLELGCGNGKNLTALVGRGFELHAVDFSPAALELCRRNPALQRESVHYYLADCRELPFQDGFFDGVAAFHVLGHLLEAGRLQAACEAVRVLRPRGRLFVREFGSRDFRNGNGERLEEGTFRRKNGVFTHYFGEGELRLLLREAGLKAVSLTAESWTVCFRGVSYAREELVGEARR